LWWMAALTELMVYEKTGRYGRTAVRSPALRCLRGAHWFSRIRRGSRAPSRVSASILEPQDRHERFLRQIDFADALHALFAGLLLLEELALARNVAAVAFRQDVFANGADRFTRDDFAADG